jgi:hypothetical protein
MTTPQTIINLGTAGTALNGQNGSSTSADTNDALLLDWPGDNAGDYVYLPGVGNNFLSVPNEAALNITGDVDLRARIATDTITTGIIQTIMSRGAAVNTSTYLFRISTTGALNFLFGDGTNNFSVSSSVLLSTVVNDRGVIWVRVTRAVSAGEVTFFTSSDGLTWTQLGTIQSISTNTPSTPSESLTIGVRGTTTQPWAGKVYRAQVLNGINGTTVLDIDTSVITSGAATSFTALTSQTVTINRSTTGRKSVAVVSPVYLFGTDDFMEWADNALLNFDATDSFTVLAVKRIFGNQAVAKPTVTKAHSTISTYPAYALRHSDGSLTTQGSLRDSTTTVNRTGAAVTAGKVEVMAMIVNRTAQTVRVNLNGIDGTTTDISARGSFVNSGVMRVGAFANATTNASDMELVGVAIFRRALTASEMLSLTSYYQARLS